MSECRRHPGVWTLWQLHDKGEKEGTYGLYCRACQEWCDECQAKLEAVTAVASPPQAVQQSRQGFPKS